MVDSGAIAGVIGMTLDAPLPIGPEPSASAPVGTFAFAADAEVDPVGASGAAGIPELVTVTSSRAAPRARPRRRRAIRSASIAIDAAPPLVAERIASSRIGASGVYGRRPVPLSPRASAW
jgi:hypothetical protein